MTNANQGGYLELGAAGVLSLLMSPSSAIDPAEAHDLADQFPDKLAEMIGHWEDYRRENGVILPTVIDAAPH